MNAIVEPRTKDVGFPVKRLLPAATCRAVGPFVFVDHMGPALFAPGVTDGDVRPHPHIGLATVTYLFDGAMIHRDSLGIVQRIEPGAINLMTAGSGVVHSERMPPDVRVNQIPVEGIQTWLALPLELEEAAADFAHIDTGDIPRDVAAGVDVRVLIGTLFGMTSPVTVASPTLYLDLQLRSGSRFELPPSAMELAVYAARGNPAVDSGVIPEFHLGVINCREGCTISAGHRDARVMVLGGDPLEGERFLDWNFVSSRRERIEQARAAWRDRAFPPIPGETEFIPLP